MSKLKSPLLSLGARGTIGDALTFQSRNRGTFAREKPIPAYRRTLPQQYQRWLYKDYAYLWTQQTASTRQAYASAGSRWHLTGFQYWMKYHLANLPDIVAWWTMDVNIGGLTYDRSRNAYTATIVGASPADGLIGNALSFDGLNDKLTLPAIPTIAHGSPWTVELLVAPIAAKAWQRYLNIVPPYMNLFANTYLYFRDANNNAYTRAIGAFAGEWLHAVISSNGTSIYFYRDGIYMLPRTPTTTELSFTNIGSGDASGIQGPVDNFIIYNRQLNLTEIQRHSLRRYAV